MNRSTPDFQNEFDFSNPPPRVFQWKYASCKYNVEKSNGFYTFSLSRELSQEEKAELVDKIAHYDAPENSPARPTVDDLRRSSLFPVAFSFFKLKSSGRSVLCRTCAVGKDYGGSRYGNFFSHALVLEKGSNWRDFPIDYWNSPQFANGLTSEEIDLGKTPDPLPSLDLDDVEQNRADEEIVAAASRQICADIVDRFLSAAAQGKTLVVFGATGKNAARLIKILFRSLPSNDVLKSVQFSTYCSNPINESDIFDDDAPSVLFTSRSEHWQKELSKSPRFEIFDVADFGLRPPNKLCGYAKYLYDKDFWSFVKRFDYSFIRKSAQLNAALENVATLYKIKRKKRFPDEKKQERAWNFLETQSYKIQLALLKDLSGADYSLDDSVKLLTFCVRCDKTRLESGGGDDAIDFGKLVVDFWLRQLKNSSIDDPWIIDQPKIVERIFGKTYCDLAVSYLQKIAQNQKNNNQASSVPSISSQIGSELAELRTRRRVAVSQLILTLGVHAAIFDWSSVAVGARDAMRDTYCALPSEYALGIRAVLFPIIGKNAFHWKTHEIVSPVFCADADFKYADYFDAVVNFHQSQCLELWKRGKRWQAADQNNDDPFANLDAEEAAAATTKWEIVSDERYRNERKSSIRTFQTSSSKASKSSDLAPGAESALEYFLQKRNFGALEKSFQNFSLRDLKRAQKYFKNRGYENVGELIGRLKNDKPKTPLIWFILVGIAGAAALGCETYFLSKYLELF